MAQLSSPGVSVTVIDESFYTPAAPGTVPLIVVASAENKQNSAGSGIAPGTIKSNAGTVYLLTSQKDLGDTFGTPVFKTDANNNPIHAGEQNEYGLQAAYSFLGVSNRAFVVRADVDLGQLDPLADAPSGDPANGTYWVDTQNTLFGIFEWSETNQTFTNKVPVIITDATKVADYAGSDYTPKTSIGANGEYAVVCLENANDDEMKDVVLWYKTGGAWVEVGTSTWATQAGLDKILDIAPHTSIPDWKGTTTAGDGSVWVKTTTPNKGANYAVKRFNTDTGAWVKQVAPMYADGAKALAGLDPTGGGANLALGATFVRFNKTSHCDFKLWARNGTGATSVSQITAISDAGACGLSIAESLLDGTWNSKTINFTSAGDTLAADVISTGNAFATAVNNAGFDNLSATVDSAGLVTITHKLGGDFDVTGMTGTGFNKNIFSTTNRYDRPGVVVAATGFLASLWTPLVVGDAMAKIGPDEPVDIPADGRLWYNSIIDEVDIMVHNGSDWVGYRNKFASTDPNGPQVSASAPTLQSDGTALVDNDLWISTADLENFPLVYRRVGSKWVLVDNTDQTTDEGILFRDARWTAEGKNAEETASSIKDLLESNYLDPDAPDPALYPRGMLLWNLRRSGFNVKRFVKNYIDIDADNDRYKVDGSDQYDPNGSAQSMANYYPHRWVSEAANQENGAGTFGRMAQRKVVVQALQAVVNSNQQIRDEESRVFNLLATPGYPELIGEMISLNYDRGLTAFIVADTPARLTPDATSINNWGNNVAGALEDNDKGATSFDEYMAMFYPWGYTSDNIGNNIAVPPSHMMLRTIALNDQVAYPWFAPAGTRRGGITNATAVGYITSEGEFQSVAFNTGQRDTLYDVKINPITFLTGVGLVNYGQKTRARNASALDRINVARLVVYLRRQLSILAKPYIFEPNDKITRDELKGAAESLLLELVGQRALYDYIVVCDTSNNTPARIDRNELYLDIAIEPVKAVEFIYIPLRLKNTGEIKGLK